MRRSAVRLARVTLAIAFASAAARAEPPMAPPRRIVSLNLCTDQILIDLVGRERIAALSHLAADPALSAIAEEARGLKAIRGTAEEVLARDPDLVLTIAGSTPATVSLLERLGKRVLSVPLANDLDAIGAVTRTIAQAVGEVDRGEQLLAAFDARLAAAAPADARRPSALVYQLNSLASGPGTLVDAMLTAAGFRNLARELALGPAGRLPLETLVANPPDLVVLATAPDAFRTVAADNLRHPALAAVLAERPHVLLGMPDWLCGTPRAARAVEALARWRGALPAQTGTQ
jgi:iron complex transport system substrate-binding protein